MRKLVVAACCLLAAAGCSLQPAAVSLGPIQGVSPAAATVPTASEIPGEPSQPIVGVNLYALHNYTAAQTEADGTRTLAYIKDDLHADAVDIVWNMYAPSYQSNSVVTDEMTLTAANVGLLTQLAQEDNLLVEYRPMMFLVNTQNSWEGLIKPTNPAEWFNSYYSSNLPYLQMAQKYHISEYVIGTEMNDLSSDPQWFEFLTECGKAYHGQISYTAQDWLYFPPHTQLPPTELTGVDMYEPLDLPTSASLSEVEAAYERFFSDVPTALLRRTAIQETGIEARAGAYFYPPNLRATGTLDESVQYNWFTAACETVKKFHMRAVYFWKVDLSDYPITSPASSLSTFEGKVGAIAISKCADILRGLYLIVDGGRWT